MQIRAGYTLAFECPRPTPMLLVLNIHPTRRVDLLSDQVLAFSPDVQTRDYVDGFGNVCTRLTAPAGTMTVSTEFEIYDSGLPDVVALDATQHNIHDLPDDVLVFLLGSRYCETDRLSNIAWTLFELTPPGWPRVQAILDWVHFGKAGVDYPCLGFAVKCEPLNRKPIESSLNVELADRLAAIPKP